MIHRLGAKLTSRDLAEIAQITADQDENYGVSLPPGDYILDAERRKPGHIQARAQPFTLIAGQTVRVDMTIDTDHSRE